MNNQTQNQDKEQSNNSAQQTQLSYFELFKQQMLRAWLPIPTLTKTITLFFIMSAIFIGIGIPMLILSNNIQEVRMQYDNKCSIGQLNCTLTFQVTTPMVSPVFVYYQLNNYYQNHRLYASSISTKQLAGQLLSTSDISTDCSPITLNSQLYVNVSINGTALDPNATANPCGIIAYTIFNDSFVIKKNSDSSSVSVTTNGIAWPSDLQKYQISNPGLQWYNVTDPRFMNWMRIATLPNFRKLWGRINSDLAADNYTVLINNYYDVSSFGTTKYFVLSTSNFFGSKNEFLSIIYLVMGGLCFVVAVLFLIRKIKRKRKQK